MELHRRMFLQLVAGAAALPVTSPGRQVQTYPARKVLLRAPLWIATLLFLSAVPALAETAIVIKFSHAGAPDTPKGKGSLRFKELAEKYTIGRVKVEVYPNSQLYKDKEEVEALQLGSVQILVPALTKFGPLGVREFEVFELPYIIPNKAVLARIVNGAIGKQLLKKLEPKGIRGLAYWDSGFKITTANRPLRKPEDYLGLKIRIPSSKVMQSEMRTLGAVPQVLSFAGLYQALSTGLVDGSELTPSNVYSQKIHEVQKYATLTNYCYEGYVVIVNTKFWDGLPADVRAELERAMGEATDYVNAIAQKENDDALAAIKAAGTTEIVILTEAEKKALREALLPVQKEMESRIGKDLIEAVFAETRAAVTE